ncbi:SitI3 family protein [Paractinoplanes hotanensis]|uniref:SitI3 family protein n=1 Tax=Paractinoplanes hotanensis TaxID=2906497 RepID=A0ABT0Y1V3_9ACTN|nr:SitI3 family protein [Actinoplanes hotanensis]MCM4079993.1 SitI3 family protein [Actinoplanes hotanensis]
MATEYELTLAGGTPGEVVAERAFPDLAERPTGTAPLLVSALDDRYGFVATVKSGRSRFVEVLSDDGNWEWEPEPYTSVMFRMAKTSDLDHQVVSMLTVVRRVLSTGSEDAAFFVNGDILLLTRLNGVVVKHRRDKWWAIHEGSDQIVPG